MTANLEQLPPAQTEQFYPTVLPDAPAEVLNLFDETDGLIAEAAGTINETRAAIDAFDPIIFNLLGDAGVQIDMLDGGIKTLNTLREQLDTERSSETERTKESLQQLLSNVNAVIGKAYETYPDASMGEFTSIADRDKKHPKIDLDYRLFGEEPVILNDFLDAGVHVQVSKRVNPPEDKSIAYKSGSQFTFTDISSGTSLQLSYGVYKSNLYRESNGQYTIDDLDDRAPEVTISANGATHNLTTEFCDDHATDPAYVHTYDAKGPAISSDAAFRGAAKSMEAPGLIELAENIYQGRWVIAAYGSRKESKQMKEILPASAGIDMTTQQFNEMIAKVQAIHPQSAEDMLLKYHG